MRESPPPLALDAKETNAKGGAWICGFFAFYGDGLAKRGTAKNRPGECGFVLGWRVAWAGEGGRVGR